MNKYRRRQNFRNKTRLFTRDCVTFLCKSKPVCAASKLAADPRNQRNFASIKSVSFVKELNRFTNHFCNPDTEDARQLVALDTIDILDLCDSAFKTATMVECLHIAVPASGSSVYNWSCSFNSPKGRNRIGEFWLITFTIGENFLEYSFYSASPPPNGISREVWLLLLNVLLSRICLVTHRPLDNNREFTR